MGSLFRSGWLLGDNPYPQDSNVGVVHRAFPQESAKAGYFPGARKARFPRSSHFITQALRTLYTRLWQTRTVVVASLLIRPPDVESQVLRALYIQGAEAFTRGMPHQCNRLEPLHQRLRPRYYHLLVPSVSDSSREDFPRHYFKTPILPRARSSISHRRSYSQG